MRDTRIIVCLVTALTVVAASDAWAGRLYKWVDDQGNVHYSDALPPEQVQRGHNEMSDDGVTVRSIDRAKTEQEVAAELARKQAEEKQRQQELIKAREQAMFDRMLLDTYLTEEDLIRTRDRKISTIEGTVKLTTKSVETLKQTLALLRDDLNGTEEGTEPHAKALEKVTETEQQLASFQEFVAEKKAEQAAISKEFNGYLKRFRELKAASAN